MCTSYTLLEAGALVKRRLGRKAFEELGALAAQAMTIIWVDEDLHGRAWALAAAQARRGPSLVDCTSFLIIKEQGIDAALTVDRHFRRRGFRVLP